MPQGGQRRLHIRQHRLFAAAEMIRPGGVEDQPMPIAAIGHGPGAPAPRPEGKTVQRRPVAFGIGKGHRQPGAKRPHVGYPRADRHPGQMRRPVDGMDHRAMRAFDR